MSELLQSYEADLQFTSRNLETKLSQVSSETGSGRNSVLKECESLLDEAKEIIGTMETEVISLPTSSRGSYNQKIRDFKTKLQQQEKLLKSYENDEDRRKLFGDSNNALSGNFEQRQTLLTSQASLGRASDRLRDSSRVANETENIGANILNNLRGQTEQLINSRNTLMEADGYVNQSIGLLRTMSRRMAANKLLSYAIIAVLIILIFLVLLSKFR